MITSAERWLLPDEAVDLNNCDREPIHIPGSIQPHGYLAAYEGRHLKALSDNLRSFAAGLSYVVDRLPSLDSVSSHGTTPEYSTQLAEIEGRAYDLIAHRMDGLIVCELEPRDPGPLSYPFEAITRCADSLAKSDDLNEAFDIAVRALRDLTDFDRVMGYMFDADEHGSVIAEAVEEGVDSFLGMRFPKTDIPRQARRLYTMQPSRLICDVAAQPVLVRPVETGPHMSELDSRFNMAFCQLRSVSPIHIEYLQNMGVGSSFSVSVVVDDQLVGLLACHHRTDKHLDYSRRRGAEIIGRTLSIQLQRISHRSHERNKNRRMSTQVQLMSALSRPEPLTADTELWTKLLDLIKADALLLQLGDDRSVIGNEQNVDLPEPIWTAVKGLIADQARACVALEKLSDLHHGASGGVLAVRIGEAGWLAWYRQPTARTIIWAGQPSIVTNDKPLNPRASFAAWKETVQDRCNPWTSEDEDLAAILHKGLAARFAVSTPDDVVYARNLRPLGEYVTILQEANRALHSSNEDLRQFASVAAHDIKGPLRTIRTFVPMLQAELELKEERHYDWFRFISDAGDRLFRIQSGLWEFSQVNRNTEFTNVDLKSVVDRVVSSMAADLADVQLIVESLPVVSAVGEQMDLIFTNLLQNAAKYRSSERPLKVVISSRRTPSGAMVTVSDNGIGFPSEANEAIFQLFRRVHTNYEGDGLGLAMCRKIINHHHGWIRADGDVGRGTTIEFYLPTERSFDG